MLTKKQARLLCDAHEVYSLLDDEEQVDLLEATNPKLLEAYYALHSIADGADSVTDGGNGCAA